MSRAGWQSSDVAWQGGKRPLDLVQEFVVSGIIVTVVVLGLSVAFSSPDPPQLTFKEWATSAPADFLATTLSEANYTSGTATYGPPYQSFEPGGGWTTLPGKLISNAIPIDSYVDLVKTPLGTVPDPTGRVAAALRTWQDASADQQTTWSDAYTEALGAAHLTTGYDVPAGGYGPISTIMRAQYEYAVSGGLDTAFLASRGGQPWYSNDTTLQLLYMGDSGEGGDADTCISAGDPLPAVDGCWFYNQAVANTAPRYAGYLQGGTWGVVNEVGNWPGAWWLWPYSQFYQWGPGTTLDWGDLYAMMAVGAFSLVFLFIPWIPGLRDIPKVTRVYRIMWADYYRLVHRRQAATPPTPGEEPYSQRPT